jgi:hypothetical protein
MHSAGALRRGHSWKPPHSMPALTEDMTPDPWLEVVRRKVGSIRFGSVQITVHEGRVTQVEAIEKTRFLPEPKEHSPSAKS